MASSFLLDHLRFFFGPHHCYSIHHLSNMEHQHQQEKEGRDIERVQTVLFLRHGVAKHNVKDELTGEKPNICSPAFWDPPLLDRGMREALTVRERLLHVLRRVDLVITSPLTRCIQTANLVFFPGGNYDVPSSPPPMLCLEQVREAFGIHYPDKRRDKRLLQKHWPNVQFDPSMSDLDEQWSDKSRETLQDVVQRVGQFLEWLVKRNESFVFVVSHGVWIESCFRAYFPEPLSGEQRVYNCDCFAGEIVSRRGSFVRLQNLRKI